MQLPVDVLDHIFSFLLSDRKTLIACSKDPVLTSIVERHAYHHIIVQFGVRTRTADSNDPLTFGPDDLSKIVSEKPHIVYSVRILEIQIDLEDDEDDPEDMAGSDFANTLLMFPVLECIMLTVSAFGDWRVLDSFRAALEDRLSLPTLKEVHFTGENTPLSVLNNSKNIKIIQFLDCSLESLLSPSTLPQPHSLRFLQPYLFFLLPWINLHSKELRSFKSTLASWQELSQVLEVCSGTLNKLDIELGFFSPVLMWHAADRFWEKYPIILPSLQQLTIRTKEPRSCQSWLSAVVGVANLFLSSLRHLSIDIRIILPCESELTAINFSPLADLGVISRSVPRIDLFVHTNVLAPHITRAHILSSLEGYEDIERSIKEGILIIHSEKIAPECV